MRKLFFSLITTALLTGCAGGDAHKDAQAAVDTGHQKRIEFTTLLKEVEAEGVSFESNAPDQDPAIERMNGAELNAVSRKLEHMVVLAGEIVAILNRDDIKTEGVSKTDLHDAYAIYGARAGKHLKYARARVAKLAAKKQKTG